MSERKVVCSITGSKYTLGKDYYNKKVEDYKDVESLKKYFITKKAKTYLNRGYSVDEIRNMLNVTDDNLPASDSPEIKDLITFHKLQMQGTTKKISKSLNFATHKSDPGVKELINNIRQYE